MYTPHKILITVGVCHLSLKLAKSSNILGGFVKKVKEKSMSIELKDKTEEIVETTPIALHRAERFVELGFSEGEAKYLANAKKTFSARSAKGELNKYELPLYHGDIKKMLDDGWTHGQILHTMV
jgi:hypothetical protein